MLAEEIHGIAELEVAEEGCPQSGSSVGGMMPSKLGGKLRSAPYGRWRVKCYWLSAVCALLLIHTHPHQKQKRTRLYESFFYGGDSWNRTNDLMHVKHAL